MNGPVGLRCIPLVAPLHAIGWKGRITPDANLEVRGGALHDTLVKKCGTSVIHCACNFTFLMWVSNLDVVLQKDHDQIFVTFWRSHWIEVQGFTCIDGELGKAIVRGLRCKRKLIDVRVEVIVIQIELVVLRLQSLRQCCERVKLSICLRKAGGLQLHEDSNDQLE